MDKGISGPKKILAIKLRDLGDTALWTSALSALKQSYPDASLQVLVKVSAAPLLEHHPDIDRCFVVKEGALSLIKSLLKLRAESFDLAMGFHATTSLCRWLFLLKAKTTVLHHHSWKFTPKGSSLAIPNPGELQDAISRDYESLRALKITSEKKPTKLVVSNEEKIAAQAALKAKGVDSSKALVVLLPGARVATRRYPKDLWMLMVKRLKDSKENEIIVVADKTLSREWGLKEISQELGISYFDDVSLRHMMAIVSQASVAIANDSGPVHIAAALGVKTVALFGPGCFGDWHPYSGPSHEALRIEVDCRPYGPRDQPLFQYCTLESCSHLTCLRKLSPDKIASTALTLADKKKAHHRQDDSDHIVGA